MSDLVVTAVRLTDASLKDVRRGLVGFVSIVLNDSVRIDGIALRRTRTGHSAIAFPGRRDARGRYHAIIYPLGRDERRRIEAQILCALGILQEELP